MSNLIKLALIGDGGHSRVVRDIIKEQNKYQLAAILDDTFKEPEEKNGIYYGKIFEYNHLMRKFPSILFFVAIGDNGVRARIVKQLSIDENQYATLIHPSTIISSSSEVAPGSVVMPGSIINANTKIGKHAIINTGSIIEHDNSIQDFVHISPNATLTGGVSVRTGSHIGASATVIPKKTIGEWAIIGAGSVVINDISNHRTAVGNPARYLMSDRKEKYNEKKNIFVSSAHERK